MNKIPWKFIWAFCIPLNFAIGSFCLAYKILDNKTDVRNCNFCNCFSLNCADQTTLFWYDFFFYTGIVLIVVSVVIPSIISYKNEKVTDTKFFK